MLRLLATVFATLLGLAFGSFLNVCLSRWPEGESVVKPRSHCRTCNRTLTWWENIPVLSWLALRGRCRTCHAQIHWRYPLIEAAVGVSWGLLIWRSFRLDSASLQLPEPFLWWELSISVGFLLFAWLMVALAALDAEHLWLPDKLTLPGIVSGMVLTAVWEVLGLTLSKRFETTPPVWPLALDSLDHLGRIFGNIPFVGWMLTILAGPVIAAALILIIRWVYWLFRRQEGIGLGDAKLMALLAAWLGLPGALLSFFLGVLIGALVAVPLLMTNRTAQLKLPLGTFLSIGGIVTALWGQQILAAYLTWSGY